MKLLKKLIEIKSYSGEEKKIQEYILGWFEKVGLKSFWQGENVVVKVSGEDSSKALIFNAHVDTVNAGDLVLWKTNPFKAVVKQGKIYGSGASDEKAGVASLMLLGEELVKQKPAVDVWLTFVVKEEVDGSGTKSFLDWFVSEGYINEYIDISGVLVEPTGLKEIELGHKGNVFVKITTKGKSGHGSKPVSKSDHAVWKMVSVMKKLEGLAVEWQEDFKDPVLGEPSMAIPTFIKSGSEKSPNKIGGLCKITVDIRTTPKCHHQVIEKIKQELKGLAEVELMAEPGYWEVTDKKEKIVGVATKIVPRAKLTVADWSNDMCFFTLLNIPAVVVGPGEKECAHQANEYCYLSKIPQAVKIYGNLIQKWGRMK
ncbi:MAG: M20/M25/M40 family metallo-hydrolase [Candidatus Beckwithbacteria bacterium]|nr:M20/M25/M40 family metallo-hydrolase [Patescibacteria group bacterium]